MNNDKHYAGLLRKACKTSGIGYSKDQLDFLEIICAGKYPVKQITTEVSATGSGLNYVFSFGALKLAEPVLVMTLTTEEYADISRHFTVLGTRGLIIIKNAGCKKDAEGLIEHWRAVYAEEANDGTK